MPSKHHHEGEIAVKLGKDLASCPTCKSAC